MAEQSFNDILSVNIDSNETRFYNLSAAETLTVGPNGEISFNTSQSTIPGILNATASYAITASYAMNGGGGGSTDTGSLLKTASFSNPNLSFTKGDSTSFNVDISSLNVTTASYARTASYSKTLGASLFNDEGSGNARLALLSSDGTYISTVNYLTSSLALTASSAVSSSYAVNGGVTQIIAGTNITLSPTNGLGAVTINSTGGGSGAGANVTASFTNQSTWTFTHALANRGVVVQTFDTSWNQTIPQNITLTDDNTATITFPLSQSGYAIASLGGVTTIAATASYALTATSASYASTASYVLQAVSSSFASTASYVTPYEGAWISYTPNWTAASSNPVIGNGTIEGWYKVVGKTCFVRGNIAMGSTTTFGSGEWYVSMPFTASHADAILMTANLLDNGTAWYNATMNGARAGFNYKATIQYQVVGGTADSISSNTPFTWTNSDRFLWNGSYEIA